MAASAYIFLLTISLVSGAFFPVNQNESPLKMNPKLPYQRRGELTFPNTYISQSVMHECLRRFPSEFHWCYRRYFRRIRNDINPELTSNSLNAINGKLMPDLLKENDKPDSYINSVLDENKRDSSNFNASDNTLNSTWIEIKDPRKTAIALNSEMDNAEEFISITNKTIAIAERDNSSNEEEKGIRTSSMPSDSSSTDEKTTTETQQRISNTTKINDIATGDKEENKILITGDTSNVSLIKETISNQDFISTKSTDIKNIENTYDQNETTSVSSSENEDKRTTVDLQTDSVTSTLQKTTKNSIVNESDLEVTSEKGATVKSVSTEENMSTESRNTLTSTGTEKFNDSSLVTDDFTTSTVTVTENRSPLTTMVPEKLKNDTSLATADFTASTVFITTLPTDRTESTSISVSDENISHSSETESEFSSSTAILPSVSVIKSSVYTTENSDDDLTSTSITDSKTSNGDSATKSIPVIPEHTINIRSIKIAKVVLSVLLLVTGLIAVVMLAVYFFKVRRGAVQYDQLTLLP